MLGSLAHCVRGNCKQPDEAATATFWCAGITECFDGHIVLISKHYEFPDVLIAGGLSQLQSACRQECRGQWCEASAGNSYATQRLAVLVGGPVYLLVILIALS
jgi:hypothetical protein